MNPTTPTFNVTIGGNTWTFLSDPPPRMHLATADRRHLIWIEDAGDRIWRPETTLPRCEVVAVRHWLHEHRGLVERAWLTQVMIPAGWIDIGLVEEDGDVVIEAYAKTHCWFGVVVLGEYITVPLNGDEDIAVDPEAGELILGVGLPEHEQQRLDLAQRLWRRLPPGA